MTPTHWINVSVPSTRFASIEIPARVDNVDKAIDALGGEPAICRGLSSPVISANDSSVDGSSGKANVPLSLRLRPDDPFANPLVGRVQSSTTFLLEVRRSSEGTITPRVLGRVAQTGQFRTLSDFQIVHKSPFSKGLQLLPPVSMSNIATPRDFRFRDAATAEILHQKRLQSRISDHHNRFSRFGRIPFDAPEVPSAPDPGSFSASDAALNHPVTRLLEDEFKQRPLISKRRLLYTMLLANQDRRSVLRYVYCVAYRFSGGPWRGLWCRYGYDPRKDPNSFRFQCIDIRVKEDFIFTSTTKRRQQLDAMSHPNKQSSDKARKEFNGLNPSHPDVVLLVLASDIDFSAPPQKPLAIYQLCDLSGVDLETVVNGAQLTTTCDRKTGWVREEDLMEIRSIMKRRVSMWISLQSLGAEAPLDSARNVQQMLQDSAEKVANSNQHQHDVDGIEENTRIEEKDELDSDDYSSDEFEIYD